MDNISPTLPISEVDNTASASLLSGVPPKYADFADVFSETNVYILPEHGKHDHAIDLIDNIKPPLYRFIYNLSESKLAVFQAYIDLHLKTRFIRPSKSPARAFILFAKKPDGSF